ncbi:uncharacterized protein OCT59_007887 [Rhizophagus irregularis]|uniref:uncharacterized protein n=1 Tax=Rhizophagus irregularis TaxID=588596 RepID=UPI003316CC59|nr:hypothetical protein OCT59_007887 [Rhizophagus irregularis]
MVLTRWRKTDDFLEYSDPWKTWIQVHSSLQLENLNFKFQELDSKISYVNILSKRLQPFPAEDLTKEMMMTLLDEEYELFMKKSWMYVNF